MSFDPLDCYESGLSSCCGARVLLGMICAECKEHCDVETEDEDDEQREFTPEQLAQIERAEKDDDTNE